MVSSPALSSVLPASVTAAPITGQGREFLLLKTATDGLRTAGADLGDAVRELQSLVSGSPLATVMGSSEQSITANSLVLSHPLSKAKPFANATESDTSLLDGLTIQKWVGDVVITTVCRHLSFSVDKTDPDHPTVTYSVTDTDRIDLYREMRQAMDSALAVPFSFRD